MSTNLHNFHAWHVKTLESLYATRVQTGLHMIRLPQSL